MTPGSGVWKGVNNSHWWLAWLWTSSHLFGKNTMLIHQQSSVVTHPSETTQFAAVALERQTLCCLHIGFPALSVFKRGAEVVWIK